MRDFYESDCPITLEEFQRGAEMLGYSLETLSDSVRVFDQALQPDKVKRECETQRVTVNKTTHRIRFENETESSVDVVIEPRG